MERVAWWRRRVEVGLRNEDKNTVEKRTRCFGRWNPLFGAFRMSSGGVKMCEYLRQIVTKVEDVYEPEEYIDKSGSFSRSKLSWQVLGTICM